jgi:formate hydrogenlyase subunit 3/multisubunit Na+/H+ antiporter MnhD subunit
VNAPFSALDGALTVVAAWLAIGLAGIAVPRGFRFVAWFLFPLSALLALALGALALAALPGGAHAEVLAIGLPGLPFHVRLDALSAFFLAILGLAAAGISIFAGGYFRAGEGTAPGLICLQYHVFLAAMAMVMLADDAYAFMVSWELMALASFFLVTTNHRIPEIQRAGFLYLLIAHVGAIAILLCFGVLQANSGDYTFANMRAQHLAPARASIAFLLALFGFGAKAGLLPLHVWLPEAHPAAPSPVSALMSGVMLKTAIYGMARVCFDLLGTPIWWWGVVALVLGLATALFGVVFAAAQVDMKRLLAYSSIENIGLVVVAFGLAIVFAAYGMQPLAALALMAMLYHCANHAIFKSLLFLGTGSVLHATGERNLGRLGGLLRRMPWVGWTALAGSIAAAGLPPSNGFVSEWLLLQGFLFTGGLPNPYLRMLVPIFAAGVVLVAALAGYVMVKFFGVIFLGRPREARLAAAHDAGFLERLGLAWLAAGCALLGLFPVAVLQAIDPVPALLIGRGLVEGGRIGDLFLLAPVSAARASYSPFAIAVVGLAIAAIAFAIVRRAFRAGAVRRSAAWNCGMPPPTPRMQDTAEGFGQPIRQIFEPMFRMRRELPTAFDAAPRYKVTVEDPLWFALYRPIAAATEWAARLVGRMQRGRIAMYLLYSFLTLVALLFLAQA